MTNYTLEIVCFILTVIIICLSFYYQNIGAGIGWSIALMWFIIAQLGFKSLDDALHAKGEQNE